MPPTAKDLIHALIRSAEVPLAVDASCEGVGAELGDMTIGAYVSGLLAELSDPEARNAVETDLETSTGVAGEPIWRARVMIGQARGEVVWRWGVEFALRQADRTVIPESYRCLGAG